MSRSPNLCQQRSTSPSDRLPCYLAGVNLDIAKEIFARHSHGSIPDYGLSSVDADTPDEPRDIDLILAGDFSLSDSPADPCILRAPVLPVRCLAAQLDLLIRGTNCKSTGSASCSTATDSVVRYAPNQSYSRRARDLNDCVPDALARRPSTALTQSR